MKTLSVKPVDGGTYFLSLCKHSYTIYLSLVRSYLNFLCIFFNLWTTTLDYLLTSCEFIFMKVDFLCSSSCGIFVELLCYEILSTHFSLFLFSLIDSVG